MGTHIQVDVASGREWTGAQIRTKILNVAAALVDKYNFQPGTVVCISHDHSDLTCLLALGVVLAGGIVASAYPLDPYAEVLYLARKTEPKFLFCSGRNLNWAKQLQVDLGYHVVAIIMGSNDQQHEDFGKYPHFQELLDYDHTKSPSLKNLPVACQDLARQVAFVSMSSGTTGKPKAVSVTHWSCIADLKSASARRGGKNIMFGCSSSLDYVSGRMIILGAIESGYTAVILNGFQPKSYLEAIQRYRINVVFLGAASFYNLITYTEIDNYDISSVKVIFPMGAKIIYLDQLREFFQKHPHIVEVKQGYGASEISGGTIHGMSPNEYLLDSENCGCLLPGMRAKVVDPVSGRLLGTNQTGMLHIRGETVFPGYYDKEAQRARGKLAADGNANEIESPFVVPEGLFDEDGFYITGDLAYFNDKEQLYFQGRQNELMTCRASKRVLPQELEEIIDEHPYVFKVCVLGVPDQNNLTQHCPRAFIVPTSSYYSDDKVRFDPIGPDENQEVEEEKLEHVGENKLSKLPQARLRALAEDLMRFVNHRVSWEKQLTGGIVILDEIPTSRATGKMNKNYLRALNVTQVEIYGDRSG